MARQIVTDAERKGHGKLQSHLRYMRNRARVIARTRVWSKAHPDKVREKSQQWRAGHPEEQRAAVRRWGHAHLAYDAARKRQKRQDNPAHARQLDRARYAKDPEKALVKNQRRLARLREAPRNDLTAAQWREIKSAYGFRCVYCGKKMERLSMDHLTPLLQGGSHTATNIVPACQPCNSRKGARGVLVPVQPVLLTAS